MQSKENEHIGSLLSEIFPEENQKPIDDPNLDAYFFWQHVNMIRYAARHWPLMPHKKTRMKVTLGLLKTTNIKEELKRIINHASHALKFIEKIEGK